MLRIVGGFLAGIVLGGLTMSHVWIRASAQIQEAEKAMWWAEQRSLLTEAVESGDRFREALHAVNVADGTAGIGFELHDEIAEIGYWKRWEYPFIASCLSCPELDEEKLAAGQRLLLSQERQRAALALERFGREDLADEQWALARAANPELPAARDTAFARESEATLIRHEAQLEKMLRDER